MDFLPPQESSASPDKAALYSVVGIDPIKHPSSSDSVHAAARPLASSASVQLPPIDTAAFVSGRHEVNPAIALNLIQDIQRSITQWQAQQRQVITDMRTLHAQGPMVDGWLQSSLPSQPAPTAQHTAQNLPESATILRHGDADALMRYVEALEDGRLSGSHFEADHATSAIPHAAGHPLNNSAKAPFASQAPHNSAPQTSAPPTSQTSSQYWLCCLGDDGTVQSQLCPPEQMATVGTAIARFQQFKQLKLQQQALETKLQQAVDLLTGVRANICG